MDYYISMIAIIYIYGNLAKCFILKKSFFTWSIFFPLRPWHSVLYISIKKCDHKVGPVLTSGAKFEQALLKLSEQYYMQNIALGLWALEKNIKFF